MEKIQKARKIIQKSQSGLITSKELREAGIHPCLLQKLVEKRELHRYARGIYIREDVWEDQLYLLQKRYPKGVFSHETALYLLGYSDSFPERYTMTFPRGYHCKSLKDSGIEVKYTSPETCSLGIIEIPSLHGNPIRIYDLERTLCDLVHCKQVREQIALPAIHKYISSRKRNLIKLENYAKKLHVSSKLDSYLEILIE